jgi:hypothetical protein
MTLKETPHVLGGGKSLKEKHGLSLAAGAQQCNSLFHAVHDVQV